MRCQSLQFAFAVSEVSDGYLTRLYKSFKRKWFEILRTRLTDI